MSEIDKDYKKVKEAVGNIALGYIMIMVLAINGFATTFLATIPLGFIKKEKIKNAGFLFISIVLIIINTIFVFETTLYKKYFGIKYKNLDLLEQLSCLSCDDEEYIIPDSKNFMSLTDFLVTELQISRIKNLSESEMLALVNENVYSKRDKEKIIESGFSYKNRRDLVRDGKLGWYSSEKGLSFFIDLFFLFIWYKLVLDKNRLTLL